MPAWKCSLRTRDRRTCCRKIPLHICARICNISVLLRGRLLPKPNPPVRRIQRAMAVMGRRKDIVEVIPCYNSLASLLIITNAQLTMSNHHPADLILRHSPMHRKAKPHKHPRQPRRLEHQQPQERQHRIRIPPTPDIHQHARQRSPQKRDRKQRRETKQRNRGETQQPREARGTPPRRLLQKPRVPL